MNIGHVQNYKIINCSWKINVLVLTRAYWWENLLEINKRTGTFISSSGVVMLMFHIDFLKAFQKHDVTLDTELLKL